MSGLKQPRRDDTKSDGVQRNAARKHGLKSFWMRQHRRTKRLFQLPPPVSPGLFHPPELWIKPTGFRRIDLRRPLKQQRPAIKNESQMKAANESGGRNCNAIALPNSVWSWWFHFERCGDVLPFIEWHCFTILKMLAASDEIFRRWAGTWKIQDGSKLDTCRTLRATLPSTCSAKHRHATFNNHNETVPT